MNYRIAAGLKSLAGAGIAFGFLTMGSALAQDAPTSAQADLAKYTSVPSFAAPGEPFDAKQCMAGKSVLSIPGSSSGAATKSQHIYTSTDTQQPHPWGCPRLEEHAKR